MYQQLLESIDTNTLKNAGKYADELFNQDILQAGIKVEMEHTNDAEVAKQIAKDHITETGYYDENNKIVSDYYKELEILEAKLKANLKNKKTVNDV